jgi:hypothetical protein
VTVLLPPILVRCVPPTTRNRDGTLGFVLPGLRPFDLTPEAAAGWAALLAALVRPPRPPPAARHYGWRIARCRGCGARKPTRTAGRTAGLCAYCSYHARADRPAGEGGGA